MDRSELDKKASETGKAHIRAIMEIAMHESIERAAAHINATVASMRHMNTEFAKELKQQRKRGMN